jgi:hypothetical protein
MVKKLTLAGLEEKDRKLLPGAQAGLELECVAAKYRQRLDADSRGVEILTVERGAGGRGPSVCSFLHTGRREKKSSGHDQN